MSKIHRRRPRRYKFEFSFVGNDRRPSQKSGTRRENRNAPDSPDLSPSIRDDRGYLRFRVFISRQNLGQSGNSKIPDRRGFSRHMKTRLKGHMSGKPQTIGDFTVSRLSQISQMSQIADHRRNQGRVGKIETLPILQICLRPSQTIGDIYDFEFSLAGKIWDSRETVKFPIVWGFPDI